LRPSLLAAALAAAAACAPSPAPSRLAGLPRTAVMAGQRAVKLLAEMHGGRFRPEKALVAEYGKGRLTLYLARFSSATGAQAALERMLRGLAASPQFSSPAKQQDGRYLVVGPGGHHLFWRAGEAIYWVAGEPALVFDAAGELPAPPQGHWT